MVEVARFFMSFTQRESCGKCVPCREGTKRMLEILQRMVDGKARPDDIEKLEENEFVELSELENQTELVHGDVYVPFISKGTYNKTSISGKQKKRIYLYERGSQFDFLRNIDTTYMWVSPLPDRILQENRLVQKKCPQSLTSFCDILIYDNEKKLSSAAIEFISLLKETQHKLDCKHFN